MFNKNVLNLEMYSINDYYVAKNSLKCDNQGIFNFKSLLNF